MGKHVPEKFEHGWCHIGWTLNTEQYWAGAELFSVYVCVFVCWWTTCCSDFLFFHSFCLPEWVHILCAIWKINLCCCCHRRRSNISRFENFPHPHNNGNTFDCIIRVCGAASYCVSNDSGIYYVITCHHADEGKFGFRFVLFFHLLSLDHSIGKCNKPKRIFYFIIFFVDFFFHPSTLLSFCFHFRLPAPQRAAPYTTYFPLSTCHVFNAKCVSGRLRLYSFAHNFGYRKTYICLAFRISSESGGGVCVCAIRNMYKGKANDRRQ